VMMASAEEQAEDAELQPGDQEINPSVVKLRVKSHDLRIHMFEHDPLVDNILKGCCKDRLFSRVLEKPMDHPGSKVGNGWRTMDVLCMPSTKFMGMGIHR
jgi:hypothetical protein